jgi:hypothetical protein
MSTTTIIMMSMTTTVTIMGATIIRRMTIRGTAMRGMGTKVTTTISKTPVRIVSGGLWGY